MKLTWEQLVDDARGLADPTLSAQISADPEAAAIVSQLRQVFEAGQEAPDELWILRAKSLMVADPQPLQLRWGRLVPPRFQEASGYRSGGVLGHLFSFDFEDARLDVSVRPARTPRKRVVRGVVEASPSSVFRVGTESEWQTIADDEGQFTLTLSAQQRGIRLQEMTTQQVYQVEIPDEH